MGIARGSWALQLGKARRQAIIALLAAYPDREWSAADIHQRLMRNGTLAQIKDALYHLTNSGKVLRVGPRDEGIYRLGAQPTDASYPLPTRGVG